MQIRFKRYVRRQLEMAKQQSQRLRRLRQNEKTQTKDKVFYYPHSERMGHTCRRFNYGNYMLYGSDTILSSVPSSTEYSASRYSIKRFCRSNTSNTIFFTLFRNRCKRNIIMFWNSQITMYFI